MRIWYGLLAPAGTPETVVDKLAGEVDRIIAMPDTRQRLEAVGMDPYTLTRAQFGALMQADREKYARIIKQNHIKLD
jgi:tripartite-type tricarboxylate transporter receptor subunit TctC